MGRPLSVSAGVSDIPYKWMKTILLVTASLCIIGGLLEIIRPKTRAWTLYYWKDTMSKYNEKVFIYAHSIFTITSGILLILMAYCDELIAIFMVLEIINAIAFFLFLRGKRLK